METNLPLAYVHPSISADLFLQVSRPFPFVYGFFIPFLCATSLIATFIEWSEEFVVVYHAAEAALTNRHLV